MKKWILGLLLAGFAGGHIAFADTLENKAQKIVKSVQDGCKTELGTFCKDVTPGAGRALACLYAFEDKISSQCEYALYDAASQLERAAMKLQHVTNECAADINKNCSELTPGQGHILNCLKKNEKNNAANCNQAIKATGLAD